MEKAKKMPKMRLTDDCYSKTEFVPDGTGEYGWRRAMSIHCKV